MTKDELMNINFSLPENIASWLVRNDGVNVSINLNNASADYGYGHMIWYTVVISMLTRTCHRCGYDRLWNPDDSESKCIRHSYNSERYDEVFAWSAFGNPLSLDEAFDIWQKEQGEYGYKPIVKKMFGRFGWGWR